MLRPSKNAGSVRLKRLDAGWLHSAEMHGKRLDEASKKRAINDIPPITSTGLELRDLFNKHVEGVQVSKNTKLQSMQMLLAFPTGLMDGNDGEALLKHARKFAESIFGENAVFADRVDRDEKNIHHADLFIAPKYLKEYKPDKYGKEVPSAWKFSISKHLKELAAKYDKTERVFGQGQALQSAWYEYLRDEVGLGEAVKRGKTKTRRGDDWKSPEMLDHEAKVEKHFERSKNMRKRSLDRFSKVVEREKELDAKIAAFEAMKQKAEADLAAEQDRAKVEFAKAIEIEETRLKAKERELNDQSQRLNRQKQAVEERDLEVRANARKIVNASEQLNSGKLALLERERALTIEKNKIDQQNKHIQITHESFVEIDASLKKRSKDLENKKIEIDHKFQAFESITNILEASVNLGKRFKNPFSLVFDNFVRHAVKEDVLNKNAEIPELIIGLMKTVFFEADKINGRSGPSNPAVRNNYNIGKGRGMTR